MISERGRLHAIEVKIRTAHFVLNKAHQPAICITAATYILSSSQLSNLGFGLSPILPRVRKSFASDQSENQTYSFAVRELIRLSRTSRSEISLNWTRK